MEDNGRLYNFIKDFLADDTRHTVFISDAGNNFNVEHFFKSELNSIYGEGYFYHKFDTTYIPNPYEPYLEIIKSCYESYYSQNMSLEEFVKACGVYALQEKTFISYFETGKASREEKAIIAETDYEKRKMHGSILNMLKYISNEHRLLIVLNRAQCAPHSTLELSEEIHKIDEKLNLSIITVFNDTENSYFHCTSILCKNVDMHYIEEEIFDYDYIKSKEQLEASEDFVFKQFDLKPEELASYNEKLNNFLLMYALDDMEYFVNRINIRLHEKGVTIDTSSIFSFYYYGALCHIYLNNDNLAVFMAEKLSASYNKKLDKKSDYLYHFICNQIHVAAGQWELAEKYALICMDLARKRKDEFDTFFAVVLFYEAKFGGWNTFFQIIAGTFAIDVEWIGNLKKYGYRNILAHYLIYAFTNDDASINRMAEGDTAEYYTVAMNIIREIGNTDLEISAYTKCIVLMNNKGYTKEMDEFYKNKLHLLTGENNPKREANLYRGLGYSYVFNERFDEGEESFLKAIHILYDMRTADEVAETLYNIVIARICVQDYKTAGVLCRHMFGMLDNLNRKTIALCSQSKLLSLRAICSYMMGNEYKSYGDLKKIRKLMELKKYGNGEERNSDDVFLYELIEALFSTKIGEYEEARYHFEKARDIFSNLSTAVFYALVLFYTEYYSLLVKVGDKKKSAELMVEAMHCCEKHGFEKMADTIKNKIDGKEYICIKKKNPIDDAMAEKLLDLSVNVGRENTIIKQKKQIWFLSLWQEMLNREWIDKKVLLHETLNLFQDSFNLDRMLYVSIDGGNIRKEYSNFKVDKSKFAAIRDYFEEEKMSFLISRTNSRFSFFKPIFEMLESEEVYTLIGIPVYIDNTLVGIFVGSVLDRDNDVSVLTYDDLTIMKTAVMQAYNTLERIGTRVNLVKTNEKLSELAITDQLTGLYNRQGAVRVIEKLSKIQHEIPVLGIDLDNFKYYNDTFGHEMGDMILSNFAAILNRVTREDDYVIRYGGDEFVILFSNGDVEVAKKVASRIYDAMESDLHEKVIDAIGKDKIIPNDKKLSCSIGIAVAKDSRRSSIHEALIRADEALYDIKKAGKGDFCVWCEKMGGGSACTPLRNLVGK